MRRSRAGFGEAHFFEELVAFGGGRAGRSRSPWSRRCGRPGCPLGGTGLYSVDPWVGAGEAVLVDVGDVELGLGGDEVQIAGIGTLLVGEVGGASGLQLRGSP